MTGTPRYYVYGLVVESDFALSSVGAAQDSDGSAAVALRREDDDFFRTRVTLPPPAGDDWVRFFVLADRGVYMKIGDVCETIVSADGRIAYCHPLDGVDERAFEANVMNFVVSTALMLQGDEMLHGTVVETGDRTIGLLGHSGAGKSTLAARLLAGGGSLVTDDTLRLSFKDGRPLAYPGPMRLKLFDEPARRYMPGVSRDGTFNAVSGKYMIAPPSDAVLARQARQVAALFWIEHPDAGPEPAEISVTRLAGAELARCLVASTMNGRYNVPERLARQFRFAEQVGRVMPVFMLRYPRTFDVMDRLVREIAKATDIRETAP